MPVSDKNQQISVVLPKEYIELLDKYIDAEVLKSRSSAASQILIKFLRTLK